MSLVCHICPSGFRLVLAGGNFQCNCCAKLGVDERESGHFMLVMGLSRCDSGWSNTSSCQSFLKWLYWSKERPQHNTYLPGTHFHSALF